MPEPLGRLIYVDPRTYWKNEATDFTPWLAEEDNLSLLSDSLGIDLQLEGVEVSVGPYKADIIAFDPGVNERVVIENQLTKTNHDHLGKVLTYAAGLSASTVVWIAQEFTDEHRRVADWLNEAAGANLKIYALELKLCKIGDSPLAPQFAIVSQPNEYAQEVGVSQSNLSLSATKILYKEFWESLREYMVNHQTFLKLRKPRPQSWYGIAVGRSRFRISLTASAQKKRIGCEIYIRGSNANQAFHLLERDKTAIEEELGTLQWQLLSAKQDCRIVEYKNNVDVSDKAEWPTEFAWLKERAEAFHRTFSHRIKALDLHDSLENSDMEEEDEE